MIDYMGGAVTEDASGTVAARRPEARDRRAGAEQSSTEWPAFTPQTGLGEGPLGAAQAADREIARLFAVRARALAEFSESRPASADRAQGERGAMSPERWASRPETLRPVSEWAAQEASIGLVRGRGRAEGLLDESRTLVQKLPGTLAALEGGLLTPEHLRPLVERVAVIADDRLRAEIEAEVLRWVAARAARSTITVPAQLADKVLRVVTRRDARDAAQRALKAMADRGVFRQHEWGEGLAGLGVVGTVPEIEALHAALSACVDALPRDAADARTRAQKMLDVLLDLVLRPGASATPPVQVVLTLVASVQTALGGDAPASLNGRVVSAETARQVLNALAGAGLGDGVLEELRHLTDTGPVDAGAADTAAGADADSGSGCEADAGAGDRYLDDPGWEPWEPEMRAALAKWESDWERRLLAGEFDDPDPMPQAAMLASVDARLAAGEIDLAFERELADAQDHWWAEFEAGRITDPDPPEDRSDPPVDPPPGCAWWGAADQAVSDANQAVVDALRALARARRLVRTAAMADAADETAWRAGSGGRVDAAQDALAALAVATDADRQALADLLVRSTGGGLAERPRIALVDAVSGALVSLTDLTGLRRVAHCGRRACRRHPERCGHDLTVRPGLGAPPPTAGYRPSAELDRFLRLRDQRCRFPGCRLPVSRGELDHRVRWPDGPTDVTNLAGLCTGDHRGKHQAPGFRYDMTDDGTLVVTTPSDITATTEAPPF
ncbi:HNH endonuclease [Geodermatophilus sp. URMC 64]